VQTVQLIQSCDYEPILEQTKIENEEGLPIYQLANTILVQQIEKDRLEAAIDSIVYDTLAGHHLIYLKDIDYMVANQNQIPLGIV